MNKTLLLASIALVATAALVTPAASACYSTSPHVRYVVCDGGDSREDAHAAFHFVLEGEPTDAATFVQGTHLWDLLL